MLLVATADTSVLLLATLLTKVMIMKNDDFPGNPNKSGARGVRGLRPAAVVPEGVASGNGRAAMVLQAQTLVEHVEPALASALVGDYISAEEARLEHLLTRLIVPSPYQPRLWFDQTAIEELATSIQTIGLGKPIIVRPLPDGRYELIGGERRWRACCLAGIPTILAIVRPLSDEAARMLAMTDNEQEDLSDYEWGRSYQNWLADGSDHSQRSLARRLGINVSIVSRRLMLTKLPEQVTDILNTAPRLITTNYVKRFLDFVPEHTELVVSVVTQMRDTGLQQEAAIRAIELELGKPGKETKEVPVQKVFQGIGTFRISGKKLEISCDKCIDPELLSRKIETLLNGLNVSDLQSS